MGPLKPCLGCGRLTPRTRCVTCAREKDAQYDARHRDLRQQALERDGYRCQCSGCDSCSVPPWSEMMGECRRPATTADHLVPLSHGGTQTLDNYAAMCLPCNSAKRNRRSGT